MFQDKDSSASPSESKLAIPVLWLLHSRYLCLPAASRHLIVRVYHVPCSGAQISSIPPLYTYFLSWNVEHGTEGGDKIR